MKNLVLYVTSFLIFPDNADQNATQRKTTQKRHEITHHFWKKLLPSLEIWTQTGKTILSINWEKSTNLRALIRFWSTFVASVIYELPAHPFYFSMLIFCISDNFFPIVKCKKKSLLPLYDLICFFPCLQNSFFIREWKNKPTSKDGYFGQTLNLHSKKVSNMNVLTTFLKENQKLFL